MSARKKRNFNIENKVISEKVTSKYKLELCAENLIKVTKGNQRMYILVIQLYLKTCPKDYITSKWLFELCLSVFIHFYMFVT